jgi:hypothetical protein
LSEFHFSVSKTVMALNLAAASFHSERATVTRL